MNITINEDSLPEEAPVDSEAVVSVEPVASVEPQPLDARRRLRELLSVPERDRSDEVWDEIIELEIQLAPGNRIAGGEPASNKPPRQGGSRQGGPRQGGGGHQVAGNANGQQQKNHRPRTKNNRRPRPNKPAGDGTPN
ncbi:MAG: hypothetical protein L6Q40_03970 [Azonexus sp.]|nr:hypothetical protein [Azonexus sp.]